MKKESERAARDRRYREKLADEGYVGVYLHMKMKDRDRLNDIAVVRKCTLSKLVSDLAANCSIK